MEEVINVIDWSRAQFALTAIYHWLFVPLTLGLGVIVAIMESIFYRTRDEKWLATTKFWATIFGVNFAIGVATGIILEFEFGTNWSNYSWFVGDIFGAPLAVEGILAFFMESTFIAVMFFGWNRVSPRFHLTATWLTALGASISAFWILVANAWMQDPVGCTFNPETMRNEMTSFWAVVSSPMAVSKVTHTVFSAWTLAGVVVVGVSGWMLMKGRNANHCFRSLKVGAWVGLVGIVLTAVSGDTSAVTVAKRQPMKLAAMEGLYEGQNGQEIVVFGILNPAKRVDNEEEPYLMKIAIPYGLSVLANHDPQSFVPGVKDIIDGKSKDRHGNEISTVPYTERMARGNKAKEAITEHHNAVQKGDVFATSEASAKLEENYPYFGYAYLDTPQEAVPNIPLTFYTFHLMAAVGGYLTLFLLAALALAYKRQLLEKAKWAKWWHMLAIATIPLTYLCSACGWVVAEVGRQPWTIQDLMPNKMAISDLSAGYVQITFWAFAVIFTVLLIADISIISKQIAEKSKQNLDIVKH